MRAGHFYADNLAKRYSAMCSCCSLPWALAMITTARHGAVHQNPIEGQL